MRTLRDYQRKAVAHLHSQWATGLSRVPMVLATGLGKTEIFTDPTLLDPFLDDGKRVLALAHTDELIEQAAKKARRNNPGRRVGIVKAERNETNAQIIVSSRQTLGHATGGPRRLNAMRNVGLIIVDEAHHALRTNSYGKILDHFGCFNEPPPATLPPGQSFSSGHTDWPEGGSIPRVAGFTATLARGDKEKLSTVWQAGEDGLIFTRDILFGIRRGYLLDVIGKRVVVPDFNMSNVGTRGGDYRESDIAEELERTFAPEIVAQRYAEECSIGGDALYRKGIAFWPLVETAYHGSEAFNKMGIRSEVIHGNLPKQERRALLARLHSGETRVVHGVGVLTEGFDEPTVDVVVIARPTRSAPLYQQMVGRVLRPDLTLPPERRGKALILDVVGAGAAHDLRSLIDLAPERKFREHDVDEEFSLLGLEDELIEWEKEEKERAGGGGFELEGAEDYAGETAVVEFDPLGRSTVWQQTPGGTWFMSAGGVGYAFLVPSLAGEPSHFDVALCSKLAYARDGVQPWARATDYVDLPLEMALAEAEHEAMELGGHGSKSLASKRSKWRKDDPNAAQQKYARQLNVWAEGMTKGECAAAIDGVLAARRIDPLVLLVTGQQPPARG